MRHMTSPRTPITIGEEVTHSVRRQISSVVLAVLRPALGELLIDAYFEYDPPGKYRDDCIALDKRASSRNPRFGVSHDSAIGVHLDPANQDDFRIFDHLAPYSIDASGWIQDRSICVFESVDGAAPLVVRLLPAEIKDAVSQLSAEDEAWFLERLRP